jgi:NAD-dependent SIR2 family protein deacetylase
MGVDSNLPDSRENEGFWKAYPPIAKLGKSFSEMADPVWFDKQTEIAWINCFPPRISELS